MPSRLNRRQILSLSGTLLTFGPPSLAAADALPRFERVADGVYAHVGDLGPRTYENEGLNANLGLAVTAEGALLIDSGATAQSAARIEAAARQVTPMPIRWVINTGGQDHRWLGNGHFAARGAQVIAHTAARADMEARGGDHLVGLRAALRERAEGTVPTLPTRWVSGNDIELTLGGLALRLVHRGGGHTPGDMMVHLPGPGIVFTGDIVYVDRLLGVIPVSNTRAWLRAFEALEALGPAVLVPGHGRVTTLATARRQTRDYLQALRAHMGRAVEAGTEVGAAVRSFDGQPWADLRNAAELMPGNANRVYLEMERE